MKSMITLLSALALLLVSIPSSPQTENKAVMQHRAMNNGLTQKQASEVLTQLAFYAGWPTVFSALLSSKTCLRSAPN
jgi:alkylhydroperoxidase/carboxymuconolactone decarboxylase family protein YurZ